MKMNRLTKDKSTKNDKRGKAVFIIPVAAIAMILIACIVDKTNPDNSESENVYQSTSDVIRNTAYDIKEIVTKAQKDAIELAKQEAVKDSNVADSAAEKNTGSADAVSDAQNGTGSDDVSDGGKPKEASSGNNGSSSVASGGQSGKTKSSGSTASSGKNSGNSSSSNGNNSPSQGGSTANEPAKSEQPKNEYVAPGWIYYGSKAGNGMTGEQKAYLDSVIKQWTSGGLSNAYIEDLFLEKIDQEWGLPMSTAGVTSGQRCLYPSLSEVPDYGENLAEVGGSYNFMGLYTKGEYDEYGYLICYYWEAGVL